MQVTKEERLVSPFQVRQRVTIEEIEREFEESKKELKGKELGVCTRMSKEIKSSRIT